MGLYRSAPHRRTGRRRPDSRFYRFPRRRRRSPPVGFSRTRRTKVQPVQIAGGNHLRRRWTSDPTRSWETARRALTRGNWPAARRLETVPIVRREAIHGRPVPRRESGVLSRQRTATVRPTIDVRCSRGSCDVARLPAPGPRVQVESRRHRDAPDALERHGIHHNPEKKKFREGVRLYPFRTE